MTKKEKKPSVVQEALIEKLKDMFQGLTEKEIIITPPDENDDIHYKIPSAIFIIEKEGTIHFYGMIGLPPDVVANIVLELTSITTLIVGESFLISHENKVIYGADNIDKYLGSQQWKDSIMSGQASGIKLN